VHGDVHILLRRASQQIGKAHRGTKYRFYGGKKMNEYVEELEKMLLKFNNNHPKHGVLFYMTKEELEELVIFIKKVCEKAKMYDDLCN
jgi:hypothetical protein